MKKSIFLSLLSLCLLGSCQSDDDVHSPTGPISEVSIDVNNVEYATTFHESEIDRFPQVVNECNTNTNELTIQHLARLNTLGWGIELDLFYHSTDDQLATSTLNSATLDYKWEPGECAENLELVVRFYNRNANVYLPRKNQLPYSHTVESMELIEQDETSRLYRITGQFEASYLQTLNQTEHVSGRYSTTLRVTN